jgi:hypothetical protein
MVARHCHGRERDSIFARPLALRRMQTFRAVPERGRHLEAVPMTIYARSSLKFITRPMWPVRSPKELPGPIMIRRQGPWPLYQSSSRREPLGRVWSWADPISLAWLGRPPVGSVGLPRPPPSRESMPVHVAAPDGVRDGRLGRPFVKNCWDRSGIPPSPALW